MLVLKLFVCLLLIYECSSSLKSCSDCTLLAQCPHVRFIPIRIKKEILINALCNKTTLKNGRQAIMICCSDLNVSNYESRRGAILLNNSSKGSEDDDNYRSGIDNHTNIRLLPETCGKVCVDDRIYGGNETDIYEFPWMALIYHTDNNGKVTLDCGGSIISSRYILTAAHCVYGKTNVGVRVGDFNIQQSRYCQGLYPYTCELPLQELRVQKTIVHKEYCKYPYLINDIALLRVKKINFSLRNVKPICLPVWKEIRNVNLSGKSATVAGWGLMNTGEPADILQKITIPIMQECPYLFGRDSNPNESSNKTFCAGIIGKDSCKGDSGGPLMIFDKYNDNYRMIQYGIVSYGSNRCGNEVPGVYTDVTKYMKWILDNMY